MNGTARDIVVRFTVLLLAPWAVLHAADTPQPATKSNPADAQRDKVLSPPAAGADKTAPRPNVLIIGASSLTGLPELVRAMLESKGIHMNVEGRGIQLNAVSQMLSSRPAWDYIIVDAWHFGRGRTDPPDFPKAVAGLVKQVRAHSPDCKIILFPWWIPFGPKATNQGVMEIFQRCVEQAKLNDIWVATTGPAFMEARLERPDLHVIRTKTDAHPGIHGSYINACSLFTLIAGQSPVGLPATLTTTAAGSVPPASQPKHRPASGTKGDFSIAPDDAKYLQEVAWKVYQREIKNTKPAEKH